MVYGEKYTVRLKNAITGETRECPSVYRYASWNEWHTDDEGCGLWRGDRQLSGTCQFTVAGCKTLKAATAKIRNAAKRWMED